jgi:hypothetical protein
MALWPGLASTRPDAHCARSIAGRCSPAIALWAIAVESAAGRYARDGTIDTLRNSSTRP